MRLGALTRLLSVTFVALLGLLAAGPSMAQSAEPIVVYSARNEQLIKPIFDRFTAETGVPIRFCGLYWVAKPSFQGRFLGIRSGNHHACRTQ